MFCGKCGKEVNDEAVVCIHCGCALKEEKSSAPQSTEGAGCFLSGLSFFFPLLGLILYFAWKDSKPKAAKDCGKAALWGFIISVVILLLPVVLMVLI